LKRSTVRQSQLVKPDTSNDENLRARINTLDYELKNLQQERGLLVLQHEKELRDLQVKAEADFKRAQAAESASKKAAQKYDALAQELRDSQNQAVNDRASLDKRLRESQEQNASLREDLEDAQGQLADLGRQYEHQIKDVEAKRVALQEIVDRFKDDVQSLRQNLEATQERLARRDLEVENLEAQVVELKSHTGDSETLSVVQRELSDQVAHIRKLESTSREQLAELRRLRENHKSVQVVEEQKRSLENELHVLQDVHRQLGEAQIQKEILEDEKRTWTSLLEMEGRKNEFDSPEAVIRALVQERIEHASFVDRLGKMEAELSEKDEMLAALDTEKASLKEALENQKASAAGPSSEAPDSKAYKRLDRQRTLAVKEVEYLRAQLKTFDTEETVLMSNENFDSQKVQQIQQLEALVDQYRSENQKLHADLSNLEQSAQQAAPRQESVQSEAQQQPVESEPRGTKRPASSLEPESSMDQASQQLGPLLRKNKNLQTALAKQTQTATLLATDLAATKSQLKTLQARSRTRILELRSNPTADAEALKMSTLKTLRDENRELLQQVRGEGLQGVKVVPVSVVDRSKLDLVEMEKVVAEKEKRMRRLREIWTDKAAEFRDVIASVLGYHVHFLPNGKVRVNNIYYNRNKRRNGNGEEDTEEDDAENSIMFDGEAGTMKISGGPNGAFAQEIKDLVKFWVQDRKEIPCFLAAMTLEFYDRGVKASDVPS
jgi:mitotic spindle assembly checkpoint protein MAD1